MSCIERFISHQAILHCNNSKGSIRRKTGRALDRFDPLVNSCRLIQATDGTYGVIGRSWARRQAQVRLICLNTVCEARVWS